ncbi:hypothetical protein A3H85_01215 [Candidatus Daviesbacteria bacterium RIFCSPLOWO2_02_FULL_40_8]|uniref:ATP synthase F1 complex delta/epsilon subunit N-terminal domain-containing protein n=1 Tax=Candidatus Daviesbacteria bacterium RIFCSPLOWO2_01_FULL_40_24 TaxID=1797787 RepID=A0A1F5MKI6_9BACT|nr:MAG: hypothetical protein A2780_00565 [Candidatus Daviesbacteria bacterium RIFCSPHIGHO2_01_FULL_41_45]OGE34010.1 MAG: hypothetical protein A3C32_01080 [Candidatus Daviesbacteria bacterium RIFCSPHIGHO2_02_FULL_41_14]OGE65865.1 MAG: hypothetical protein A3B49_02840 [Candidatus Daviesbacteria bacterium RIFCSPLOWO2_01_FULL_40_24]OGE67044.1 MAG: hypothetical protein A3H85_01215 [Candidatus Daviesbacteria bacterium RIFCSPLOWO2_02_FULL_40_8]
MDTLYVKIISPNKTIYEGPAVAVSSQNSQGNFDILPQHANFLTMTKNSPIIIHTIDKKQLEFKIPLSIIYNLGNRVSIYTDIVPEGPLASNY